MTYENPYYEEGLNLLALIASGLRKWKQLIMVVAIMALLFGLYKGVLKAGTVGTAAEIEELQAAIDGNIASLETSELTIETNQNLVENYEERILVNSNLLSELQRGQDMLLNTKEMLEATFSSTEELLEDPELSADQKSVIISQLATLADDIASTNNQILSSVQQIRNAETEISNLETSIENNIEQTEQLREDNLELENVIAEQEIEMERLTQKIGLKPAFIFAILGGVVGFIIFYGIIFLQFIFDKKLRTATELREHYTFPVLGEFYSAKAKKHKGFDQWIDQLMGDTQTLSEEQQVYELIGASIQASELTLPTSLLVTGTVDEEKLQEIGDGLSKLLPNDYTVEVAGNPIYNADLLINLKQYTILLVEAKGVSKKQEIAKLVDVLQRNEINVVGSVVM